VGKKLTEQENIKKSVQERQGKSPEEDTLKLVASTSGTASLYLLRELCSEERMNLLETKGVRTVSSLE
jgi:hypothetical protein